MPRPKGSKNKAKIIVENVDEKIVAVESEIVELTATLKAKKAELKTEDLEKVRVELEKDPAWNDLYSQCTNANAKVEAHSRKRLGIVRDRIAPSRKPSAGRGVPTAPATTN